MGRSRRSTRARSYVCVADLTGSNYGSESGNRGSRSSEFTRGTMNRSSMPRGGSPRVPLSRNGFEITARQWNCCNLVGPFRWMDSSIEGRQGKERGEKEEEKKKKKMEKDFLGTLGARPLVSSTDVRWKRAVSPSHPVRPVRSKRRVTRLCHRVASSLWTNDRARPSNDPLPRSLNYF